MTMEQKKLILIGDGNVGKTTYVKKLLYDHFIQRYVATLGTELYLMDINIETNPSTQDSSIPCPIHPIPNKIKLNIWDCAGQERFGGLGVGYYFGADCCITMFDLRKKITFNIAQTLIRKVRETNGDIPVILVGNDFDEEYEVSDGMIGDVCRELNCEYINISVKNGKNLYDPITKSIQKMFKSDHLSIHIVTNN